MDLQHIAVKFFAEPTSSVRQEEFIPVFHTWIQNDVLTDTMIDVADYAHVPSGPGVMLICHECQYGADEGDGGLGLLCANKRMASGSTQDRFRAAFRRAINASLKLQNEKSLAGRLSFKTGSALVRISDFIHTPNTPQAFELIKADLHAAAAEIFGDGVKLEHLKEDPKSGLTIRVIAPASETLATLLSRA